MSFGKWQYPERSVTHVSFRSQIGSLASPCIGIHVSNTEYHWWRSLGGLSEPICLTYNNIAIQGRFYGSTEPFDECRIASDTDSDIDEAKWQPLVRSLMLIDWLRSRLASKYSIPNGTHELYPLKVLDRWLNSYPVLVWSLSALYVIDLNELESWLKEFTKIGRG